MNDTNWLNGWRIFIFFILLACSNNLFAYKKPAQLNRALETYRDKGLMEFLPAFGIISNFKAAELFATFYGIDEELGGLKSFSYIGEISKKEDSRSILLLMIYEGDVLFARVYLKRQEGNRNMEIVDRFLMNENHRKIIPKGVDIDTDITSDIEVMPSKKTAKDKATIYRLIHLPSKYDGQEVAIEGFLDPSGKHIYPSKINFISRKMPKILLELSPGDRDSHKFQKCKGETVIVKAKFKRNPNSKQRGYASSLDVHILENVSSVQLWGKEGVYCVS